ncbi:hypothetical protein FHX48_002626 [Microbacterium halimionae]|uniref:Uncharacterized protein n=1 Tax=Microbacterium halimionae TaxID=1526413 RepID=A0A7W3JR87_9MICO|nr:hypothetical protein [Microbacterium halimionae]MBA8817521.1 hypothetical protein [Microbacterium halimionae]
MLAGITIAVLWRLIRRERNPLTGRTTVIFAILAALLGVLSELLAKSINVSFTWPIDVFAPVRGWSMDMRFIAPLITGIVGLVLLAFPVHRRLGDGSAELSRRTPLTFIRGWWLIPPTLVLALILTATLAAGAASERDEITGDYTNYTVHLGGENSIGTSIYGWYFSVPALVLMALVLLVAAVDIVLISRPALQKDAVRDSAVRHTRTRNVLAAVTATFLMHLATILSSLYGTSSMRGMFSSSIGTVHTWTPFAALGPTLLGAAYVVGACGVALWASIALSAIPARTMPPHTRRS